MSAVLLEARGDLAALLTGAVDAAATVHPYVPESLSGRDVVIQPAANSLVPSTVAAGSYDVRFNVLLLVGGEDNATVHDLVAEHLSAVVPALDASAVWELVDGTQTRITTYATSEWTSYGVGFDVTATYTQE